MKTLLLLLLVAQAGGQTAELTNTESSPMSMAGTSLALVSAGAAIGAPNDNGNGAVYLYPVSPNGWQNESKPAITLVASGGNSGDQFGAAMISSGEQLFVGAPGWNNGQGAVYVFTYSPRFGMKQTGILTDSSTLGFGASLSTSVTDAKWLLVGAPNTVTPGSQLRGVADIFELVNGQWIMVAGLTPQSSDQSPCPNTPTGGNFGAAVGIGYGIESANGMPYFAVGQVQAANSMGIVYVFEYAPNDGGGQFACDIAIHGSAGNFGAALSFGEASSTLFIGSPDEGKVYVEWCPEAGGHPWWRRGKQIGELVGAPGSGKAVAALPGGKSVLVGAPASDTVGMFMKPVKGWQGEIAPVQEWQNDTGSEFGAALAWQIGKVHNFIVGAPSEAGTGAGYVF